MSLQITPLCDVLGAEVTGLDLSQPIDYQEERTVLEAYLQYHLLCFRSEPLEPTEFAAFARRFGEPQQQLLREQRHGQVPEVSFLDSTYKNLDDKPDDLQRVRLSGWHTDDSYFEAPAKATLLQSIAIPESGGQTRFCNTRAAYEDLEENEKQRLSALKAAHRYDTPRALARPKVRSAEEEAETPEVIHPIIRTHDDSGIKAIYLNPNRTDRIIDVDHNESEIILEWIYDRMTQDKYRYEHEWRVGDLIIWDNRCLVHSVNMDFPVGQKRLHQRILLRGKRPV